jgi:hypothetical protein
MVHWFQIGILWIYYSGIGWNYKFVLWWWTSWISNQKKLNFVRDHLMIIHVQFGFNQISNFWEFSWSFSHIVLGQWPFRQV